MSKSKSAVVQFLKKVVVVVDIGGAVAAVAADAADAAIFAVAVVDQI